MNTTLRIILFLAASTTLSAGPASTGMSFLTLGVGARSIAMGEAAVASATDGTAMHYNPSALSFVDNTEITVMHKNWITDVSTEYLGAAVQGETMALGFSFNTTSVSNIDIRTRPGEAEGTFNAHDMAITGSASVKVGDAVSLGLSGKFLYEKIFVDEASGYAFDAGAMYRMSPALAVGLCVNNLGKVNAMKNSAIELPALIRAGATYNGILTGQFTYTASGDVVKAITASATHIHMGGELCFNNTFAIRGGYQTGYEAKSVSGGIGVTYGMVRFDYAFVPFQSGLGTAHAFSLSFRM